MDKMGEMEDGKFSASVGSSEDSRYTMIFVFDSVQCIKMEARQVLLLLILFKQRKLAWI